ncbi:hypothetical protein BN1263400020 [Stenotrophomonas indicatrix]|nr:hypothetical protein BN1263400020 [Stenotrophomonas indicatrix]
MSWLMAGPPCCSTVLPVPGTARIPSPAETDASLRGRHWQRDDLNQSPPATPPGRYGSMRLSVQRACDSHHDDE